MPLERPAEEQDAEHHSGANGGSLLPGEEDVSPDQRQRSEGRRPARIQPAGASGNEAKEESQEQGGGEGQRRDVQAAHTQHVGHAGAGEPLLPGRSELRAQTCTQRGEQRRCIRVGHGGSGPFAEPLATLGEPALPSRRRTERNLGAGKHASRGA